MSGGDTRGEGAPAPETAFSPGAVVIPGAWAPRLQKRAHAEQWSRPAPGPVFRVARTSLDQQPEAVEPSRHLAHVPSFARHPLVFLTAVTHHRQPLLATQAAFDVFTETWRRSAEIDGWFVGDYLLMPDHVHLFARGAHDAKPLAAWVGSWKSLTSRKLKHAAGLTPPLWQADYFDRYLRSQENYRAKWDYVALNPVRKGLCARACDWPWKGCLHEFNR